MTPDPADVLILERRIERADLDRLLRLFGDMIKYVVDVERGVIAIGGELHADAEQALLERGSRPADLWGANYYPGRGREGCMEVEDPALRERIRALTFALVGAGEPL